MKDHGHQAKYVFAHPGTFTLRVLKGFRANQGLLLAGAVAYYTLLSIVPLLILMVIVLSHLVDRAELLATIGLYLGWLVPGQSDHLLQELGKFLEHREFVGWVLLGSLLFFSSLAFTVLENAMSVIFIHRVAIQRRHFMVSALLPYFYILFLGAGILLVTLVSTSIQAMGDEQIAVFGRSLPLHGVSGFLLYLLGVLGEVLVLTSVYMVMPVGRLSVRHALIGGVTAAVLWEITRHILGWYYATLSQVSVVYGSFATTIVVLLSLEFAATALLLGAQVISEYERIAQEPEPEPFHTA